MTIEGLLSEVAFVAKLNQGSSSASADNSVQIEKLSKSLANVESQLAELVAMVKKLTGTCPVISAASAKAPTAVSAPKPSPSKDDDDLDDLFDDDEDDGAADALRQKRLDEYAAKKAKKPAVVAKSSIVLDVKPWDDETDMEAMLGKVKSIEMDGLVWGASKFVPLAYGIKKLQIMCVVEDDKVSIDELTEKIQDFEDFVQSVDIAAFNKV